jgi:hypothetical protein
MYIQQHLSCASKSSNSYEFQYAAGAFGWSFETVGYPTPALFFRYSYYLIDWILDECRVRGSRYFSSAHLAK